LGYGTNTGINTLDGFERFLRIDLNQAERTVQGHLYLIRHFLDALAGKDPSQITTEEIRTYLSRFQDKSASTRANLLKSLKRFYCDFLKMPQVVESFKFPKRTYTPKQVPSKEDLRRFFDALENDRDRAFFLLAASSGLRRNELLSLTIDDLGLENQTIIPKNTHQNASTKNSWVSCFNLEAQTYLMHYLEDRPESIDRGLWLVGETAFRKAFNKANKKTDLHITPQILRFWFANEMSRLGMSDRIIDAIQGRTPRSILARHYSDFSVERLKESYDKANLRVLD
jgi:integrase